ncbi:MAG: DUF1992 domain-containing protein [Ectothiorhodospiraceae bacterium]|nr:DUF1992 domain-containing protein [Ectothiorhodospiraceae bacterium]
MWLIDELAEQRIAEAIEKGELDNLPGQGRPLKLDDDSLVPEHLRVAFRVLRNAGYLPPHLQTLRELEEAEDLLRCLPESDGAGRSRARRRLELLRLRLQHERGPGRQGPLWLQEPAYAERVMRQLDDGD